MINNTLPAIVSTLKKIVEIDHDSQTKSEANGLLRKVCAFEFILCLTVLDLLSYTKSLSDYLQREDLDFISATQQHHLSGISKYSIDSYYGTIDLMVNALEKRFSIESIRLLKGFSGLCPSRLNDSETLSKIEL